MEPIAIVLLFVVFIALAVAVAVVSHLREKRRRLEFQQLAAAQGWTYTETDGHDRPQRFVDWEPFGVGDDRRAENCLAGEVDGIPFDAFGYRYTTYTRDSKGNRQAHVHHFGILAARMPLQAPDLRVSRETLGKKVFDALGGSDIDFESDEFSRRFWVKCAERKFAYDCIDARMMEWLLAEPAASAWAWRWNGPTLLLVRSGRLEAADVLPALALVTGFVQRLPRVLAARGQGRPSGPLRAA